MGSGGRRARGLALFFSPFVLCSGRSLASGFGDRQGVRIHLSAADEAPWCPQSPLVAGRCDEPRRRADCDGQAVACTHGVDCNVGEEASFDVQPGVQCHDVSNLFSYEPSLASVLEQRLVRHHGQWVLDIEKLQRQWNHLQWRQRCSAEAASRDDAPDRGSVEIQPEEVEIQHHVSRVHHHNHQPPTTNHRETTS